MIRKQAEASQRVDFQGLLGRNAPIGSNWTIGPMDFFKTPTGPTTSAQRTRRTLEIWFFFSANVHVAESATRMIVIPCEKLACTPL